MILACNTKCWLDWFGRKVNESIWRALTLGIQTHEEICNSNKSGRETGGTWNFLIPTKDKISSLKVQYGRIHCRRAKFKKSWKTLQFRARSGDKISPLAFLRNGRLCSFRPWPQHRTLRDLLPACQWLVSVLQWPETVHTKVQVMATECCLPQFLSSVLWKLAVRPNKKKFKPGWAVDCLRCIEVIPAAYKSRKLLRIASKEPQFHVGLMQLKAPYFWAFEMLKHTSSDQVSEGILS